ncbi:ABC transporter substrate-binding protein [Pseudonocardia hispaniensis]|uniref:ABC transporter substrate-binding protein n=1 Tax=Pseudonocardia hispaniensis TaxID=904933 RepID=A0ABW1IYQ2_9PSEU
MTSKDSLRSARKACRGLLLKLAAPIVGVAVLAGCAATTSTASSSEGGRAVKESGDLVRIGVNLELSGGEAVIGDAYLKGMEAMLESVNAKGVLGGKKIELVVRDNKSEPTESLQISKKFMNDDSIVGILGAGASSTTLSFASAAESQGVPVISMGGSDAIVKPTDQRRWIFKTSPLLSQSAEVQVADLKARGITTVAYLAVANAYGDVALDSFTKVAESNGIDVVASERFQMNDKDYSPQVTKVLAAKPGALVAASNPLGSAILTQNAKQLGWKEPIYFDVGSGSPIFLQRAAAAAEGVFGVHPAAMLGDRAPQDLPNYAELKEFYSTFTEKFGDFSGFAAYGADALGLMAAAIDKAGTTDSAKVRDALESLNHMGVEGEFQMTTEDHVGLKTSSLRLLQVHDGQWTLADSQVNQ